MAIPCKSLIQFPACQQCVIIDTQKADDILPVYVSVNNQHLVQRIKLYKGKQCDYICLFYTHKQATSVNPCKTTRPCENSFLSDCPLESSYIHPHHQQMR